MLTNQEIDKLIDVEESFHAPYKIMEILTDKEKRNALFDAFLSSESDLSFDWFTDYFQMEHSDRKTKKQDFTPDGIIQVASGILGATKSNADICAGTGGLTIKRWAENHDAKFYCEEFSDRAIPFLLFNLAIRNIDAIVAHGDSLDQKYKKIYKLTKSTKYSEIMEVDETEFIQAETVIMNPPYSLPWSASPEFLQQERFKPFEVLAPKSKADYAFLLCGLNRLTDGGIMSIVLPHGVLFRGAAEGTIRKKLIEANLLDAVIGLPEKLFLHTAIPTTILVIKKSRTTKDILFIDASKEFKKNKNQNVLENKHIKKILEVYNDRKTVEKYSRQVEFSEIQNNDYNLNIPRYVDNFERIECVPLETLAKELKEIDNEVRSTEKELARMMLELVGTNPEADRQIRAFAEMFEKRVGAKYNG